VCKHGGLGQSRTWTDDHVLTRFLSNTDDVNSSGDTASDTDHGKRQIPFGQVEIFEPNARATRANAIEELLC